MSRCVFPYKYDNSVKAVNCFPNEFQTADETVPNELNIIQKEWRELSKETGDVGSCVLGECMLFLYKGQWYRMAPFSCWQGEGSWTPHVPLIKQRLIDIGVDQLLWDCGIID